MSKIGKLPINLPEGVTLKIEPGKVIATGPKGSVEVSVDRDINVSLTEDVISVTSSGRGKQAASTYGTARAKIANAVSGTYTGWTKKLELVGTGYRAEVNDRTLVLTIGYSHPVKIDAPEGIFLKVEKNVISVEGADRELVGQLAAKIRSARPPEPYQGKGIKYMGEIIRRKPGKAAKTVGTGPA